MHRYILTKTELSKELNKMEQKESEQCQTCRNYEYCTMRRDKEFCLEYDRED